MGPLAQAVPKALFPLIDGDQSLWPVLYHILREGFAAGLQEIGVVAAPWQLTLVRRFLDAVADVAEPVPTERVVLLEQPAPRGLGDAVLAARAFVGSEGFVVLLGDHIRIQRPGHLPCLQRVARAFTEMDAAAVVGVRPIGPALLPATGVCRGQLVQDDLYLCTAVIEKPDMTTARQRLRTKGLPTDRFLGHNGVYAFSHEIFECLERQACAGPRGGPELGLTEAQATLLASHPDDYFLLRTDDPTYDVGTPGGYSAALRALGRSAT